MWCQVSNLLIFTPTNDKMEGSAVTFKLLRSEKRNKYTLF